MRGVTNWQHTPYVRPFEPERVNFPYICRIAPDDGSFEVDWFDKGAEGICHSLKYRKTGTESWEAVPVDCERFVLNGLENGIDYDVVICRNSGEESQLRVVRPGKNEPGAVVVNYLNPLDQTYTHSGSCFTAPSLVKLPSGKLLALHDTSCDNSPIEADPCHAIVLESLDDGATWSYVCDIRPAFNPRLFLHRGEVYILALNTDYTDMIIGKSSDEGKTWTAPVTLFRGENTRRYGWHTGPMPIIEKDGRIWTSLEYGHVTYIKNPTQDQIDGAFDPENEVGRELTEFKYRDIARFAGGAVVNMNHYVGVMSVDADADLLKPENWTVSKLYFPWEEDPLQCIEGNIVELPDGKLHNFIRTFRRNTALLLALNEENPVEGMLKPIRLDHNFPFSERSKFYILRDPETGYYVALGNLYPYLRTELTMAVSKDFESWQVVKKIAGTRETPDAFTYPVFVFDGDDMLVISRTAWNGATNRHDTNMITFHKVENFRQYF